MSRNLSILITGANQGLGYTVSKQLLSQSKVGVHIYAAARSQGKSEKAVEELKAHAGSSSKHEISPAVVDITDDASIEKVASQFESLDILVNNAGVQVLDDWSSPSAARQAMMENFNVNVFGSVCLASAFLPKLQAASEKKTTSKKPALINVTSDLGAFSIMTDSSPDNFMFNIKQFTYPATKSAFNMHTVYAAKVYPDLRIVSVNPGYTATAFNNFSGPQTAEEGAQYITNAVLDLDGPSGVFLSDNKVHAW